MSQTAGVESWAAGLGLLRHHFSLCGVRGVSESPSQPELPRKHPRRDGGTLLLYSGGWLDCRKTIGQSTGPGWAVGNEKGHPGELAKVSDISVKTRPQRLMPEV